MKQSHFVFPKKTVKDLELHNKRVLLRADFNVPLNEAGKIDSDFRMTATLPTIEYLLKRQAEVVIVVHLGRPEGRTVPSLSLEPIAQHLGDLLKREVGFIDDCIGDKV